MNLQILILFSATIYICDVFALVWFSGKFAGVKPLNLSNVGITGLAIILLSCLILSAFIHVTFIVKPLILLVSSLLTILIFIMLFDTRFFNALAAGIFFVLSQLIIFIFLLKNAWNMRFFQILKSILFEYH